MMTKRFLAFLPILLLFNLYVFPRQKSGEEPPWVRGELPKSDNPSFYFMVTDGSGATIQEARNEADLSLVSSLMRSAGMTVSGTQKEKLLHTMDDNQVRESQESEYRYDFRFEDIHISFMRVGIYWEQDEKGYDCKALYEVARNPNNVTYQPIGYTNKYGARGLWRSALIPGWGQMYKKQYVKGLIILAAEAGGIVSSLIFENQRDSYSKKAATAIDAKAIKFYQDKANDARTVRNICIIGTAAVYVYNLVDAIAAKGKLRYSNPSTPNLSFSPYSTPDYPLGMSLCYSF